MADLFGLRRILEGLTTDGSLGETSCDFASGIPPTARPDTQTRLEARVGAASAIQVHFSGIFHFRWVTRMDEREGWTLSQFVWRRRPSRL